MRAAKTSRNFFGHHRSPYFVEGRISRHESLDRDCLAPEGRSESPLVRHSLRLIVAVCSFCSPQLAAAQSAQPAPGAESFEPAERLEPAAPDVPLGPLQLHTFLQTRYRHSIIAESQNARPGHALGEEHWLAERDGWELRRLYLRMTSAPSRYVSGKVVVDFARLLRGSLNGFMRQAYVRVTPVERRLTVDAGLLKLPYSLMKLASSARLEVADTGPTADLARDLGYAGRDLGVRVRIAPLPKAKRLRVVLGAYRGHAYDEHDSPLGLLAGRVELHAWKGLDLGASVVRHVADRSYKRPFETSDKQVLPEPPDPLFPREQLWARGTAWGADASYAYRKTLLLRAEGLWGDRVDVDERYGSRAFFGAYALLSVRVPVGSIVLQPAARAEWLDADLDHDVGTRRVLTLALQVIFSRHVRLLIDATHTDVEDESPLLDQPRPLSSYPYYELDHTQATGQLQFEI